ncbi:glycosyltransferase family 4 protein [Variovorax sp. LT1R20]|uniref:glycosyltransferase family 4 protein n=1 Tax=Variovorax sp. LT1R20 TaxID=3443729 RepID=UPI003F4669EF
MKRVCHLSSAHRGLDVRIFVKECASLAAAGYDTHLVIKATPQEIEAAAAKGVCIHPLELPSGRFSRMVKQAWRCYRLGRQLNADVYHFHDPELIPYGMLLKLSGKKVIYDVHEDLPRDILSKEWIPFWARTVISKTASLLEYVGAKWFFSIVAATPFIRERFARFSAEVIDINNFPRMEELAPAEIWGVKRNEVCYVGGISKIRGVQEVVQALALTRCGARLQLGGKFSEPDFEKSVKAENGWAHVDELGFIGREGVRTVLQNSIAGLVTLHPMINYLDALPVKMFEYMSTGLPVIASDFPLWSEIVAGNGCGLCVDPLNPAAIAEAIDTLSEDPQLAKQMGENGRRAVVEKYNWSVEEARLLNFYRKVMLS